MTTPPALWETERLVLRAAGLADARAAFDSYTSDELVPRYMTWRPHTSLGETEDFMHRCEDAWRQGLAFTWSLRLKAGGAFAGVLEARIRQHSVDIGYVLARHWWRQGLMSEAVRGLIDWAFRQPDLFRVWAVCDVDNVASARLLQSVGMQLEGTLRRWLVHPNVGDTPRDCLCYAIVKR
jgi:RimJ/RimL family protein N-acetyltransferase